MQLSPLQSFNWTLVPDGKPSESLRGLSSLGPRFVKHEKTQRESLAVTTHENP